MRALRWRRRRFGMLARRHRVLRWLRLPHVVSMPGRQVERHAYLFWRVRLPLWAVLATTGWLVLGVIGIVPGLAAAFLAELAFSYRRPRGAGPTATAGPGLDAAGVREPRRPGPSGGSATAERSVGPVRPGLD